MEEPEEGLASARFSQRRRSLLKESAFLYPGIICSTIFEEKYNCV